MTDHLYRFRPLKRLIEGGELRNQEIYFASPDQLNDPMEGFRDVFWKGDAIVWSNFFRHYVICVDNAFEQFLLCAENQSIEWQHIPVFSYGDISDGVPHKKIEEKILGEFNADPSIKRLIAALADHPFPIRRNELAAHLRAVHLLALNIVRDVCARWGIHPEVPNAHSLIESARKSIDLTTETLGKFREAAKEHPVDEHQIDQFYVARQSIAAQLDMINFYSGRVDFSQANRNFVCLTFPDEYVKQVETLVYPEWYAACFMRDCRNSAIWGSYGDNHTAVCLKFRATDVTHKPGLRLRRPVAMSMDGPVVDFAEHPFKQITYESEHLPVDFFRSLGRFPIPVLRKHWYSDEKGNHSPCGEEIFRADASWRERYWESFHHAITRKLKDWSPEEEFRLILDNFFWNFRDPATRKLNYHFADLSGVIFGIKTPMKEKLEICKIIEEKCRHENRTDFKFYQAYYSRSTGTIEHAEIGLLKFKL